MTIRGVNQQRIDSPWALYGWERWYNLNLIGKDKLPVLLKDFPNPIAPPPIDQTWVQRHVQFTGKDVLPFNQKDWPNPVPPFRIEQTWLQSLVPGGLNPPFGQSDWPLPNPGTDPASRRTWEWRQVGYLNQDKLPIRNLYPNPDPVSWYRDWSLNLLQYTLKPAPTTPFPIAKDWPLPTPVTWYQSWSWRQVDKLGLDTLPNRQQDWPNPQPINWYKSIEFTLGPNTLLVPFRQLDWPNPVPVQWYKSFEGPKTTVVFNPFIQTNWPNPYPVNWYKTWEYWYNLNLIGQDRLPNRQQDWPVPPPITWYQDFKLDLLQTTLFIPPGVPPFLNFDWPTPTPVTWYKSIEGSAFIPNIPIPPPPAQPTGGGIYPAEFYRRAMELDKEQKLHASAVELGRMGGKARLDTMSARQRSEFARNAAETRWRNR